jgi:hypothetical protein
MQLPSNLYCPNDGNHHCPIDMASLLHAALTHCCPTQGLAMLTPAQQPSGTAAAGAAAAGGQDSSSGSSSPRQRLVLLGDAVGYLGDILATGAAGDDVLLEAARVAARQAQEQLEMAKLQR